MKRKSLLFLLLLALGLPWAANAQETVEIGTGTDQGTTTNNYLPGYTLYDNTLSEQIYTAEEVTMAGTISSIAFYNGGSTKSPTVTLYMVNTDQEAFSNTSDWLTVTSGDLVFEGSVTFTANEWTTIELDTPFDYDGTSNLGLVAHIHMNPYSSGLACRVFTSTSNCSMYAYRDNTVYDPTNPGVNGANRLAVKNQIKLEITPSGSGPTCPKPTNLTVSNITSSNASFSWTKGGDETEWVLEYSTDANFTDAVSVPRSGIPAIAINDFAPATTYYAHVKALCGGGDESNWSNKVSFTTLCEAITTYPWTENFDSYTGTTSGSTNNLPQCYNYINGTTYSYYAGYPVIYNGSSNSGNNHLYLYSYYSSYYTYTDLYAILPEMEGLNGKQLTLYAKAYNASSSFTVGMMTDPTDASTFVAIDTKTPSTSIYEEFTFTLGEGNYVAFKMEPANSSSTYRGIRIDDIIIDNPPTCAKPTDLQHTGSTTTTATLSWTNGAEGQTAWQICLNGNENNLIMANSNPFTIEDLTASSVYTAKVRAYCSATDQSYWSNEISFATECDAISTLPWRENFDAYTGATSTSAPTGYPNDQLPNCWQFLNRSETTSTYPQAFLTSSTTYAVSGNCLFFKSSSTTPLYAILPDFEEEIAGLQLTFTYRNEGTTTSNGQLIVGYMTNPADASTFIEMLTCDRTSTLTEKEVLFADAPAGSYIAFKYQGGSANNYYLSIDNVSVDYAPSCPKPQSLAVTANSVTAHGAIVTWTEAGEATQWIVEFATDADFTDVLNETVNDEPTYTFQGLDPETTYYVRVKAHCGAGNESQYSNVVNFTTDAACKVPTSLTVSNVTVNTATLSWTENGESTSWQICLNNDEENLINANTNPYTLEGLTAETVYTAKVRGICNGEPTGWSSTMSFEPTAKLVIGSGTGTTSYLPSNTNYDFSYTQQIYTVAELGEAGVIESIDFYMTTTDYTRNLDIYMVSTDKESFANNTDWIAVTEADLVFSGDVNFTANSWTTITLDESFIYNGTQNVAIIVDDNTEEWSSRNFRSFTVESNQAHYCYQDNTNINPSAPSASNNSVTTSKNQIRIMKSEMSDCMKPTQFAATEVGPDFAILDWTENGASESWYIFYQEITPASGEYESIEVFEHPYTLTGLYNETPYSVFVVPSCGFVEEDVDNNLMSHIIEFTTLPGCPAPLDVELSNITHNSVDVTWTGFNDSYYVRIENNSGYSETYENAESPLTIENLEGSTPYQVIVVGLCGDDMIEVAADPVLFVTPCTPYTITETAPYTQDFEAPVVTTTYSGIGEMPSCWDNYPVNVSASAKILAAGAQYNYAEEGQVLYFYGSGNNYAALPEFTNALNTLQISFKWATESSSNGTLTLGYITAQDEDYNTFTVIKTFAASQASYRALKEETVGLGNLPETATRLVFRWYYSSQWGCNIDDVEVALMPTYTLEIEGVGEENWDGGNGGYYLIASPVTVDLTNHDMTTGDFDLYYFDQAQDLEWINYKGDNGNFNLEPGKGYLYAKKATTEGEIFEFNLTGTSYDGDGTIELVYDDNAVDFQGWNLVGNPFAQTAYPDRAFYVMNAEGSEIEPAERNSVEAMEGIFVIAENDGETMTFTTESKPGKGQIVLNVTQNRGNVVDRAIVRFGQESMLPKFMLNENHTKMYITKDNEDYAVVRSNKAGELPVNFEPAQNGTFTISVNTENLNVKYLHLIDRATGMDTDLLQTPIYKFDARTNDDPKRFVLVYKTIPGIDIFSALSTKGGNTDDFSFFSNGNWVINNDGDAILQVVDINGQILSSEQINGSVSKSIEAAPGVYMLRLINGENVKVQKVVVR